MTYRISPGILRGRLTDGELESIEALAARKLKAGQIAQRLNRHPATINFAMHRLGLKSLMPATIRVPYVRNGVVCHPFSPDEDAYITALRIQRFTTAKIADLVGKRFDHRRTPATINMRLTMLANSEAA